MTGSDDIKTNGAPARVDAPIEPVPGEPTVEYVDLDAHPFSMAKILRPGRVGRFAIEASTISRGTIVDGYQRYKGKKQ